MQESHEEVGKSGFNILRVKERFFGLPAYKQVLLSLAVLVLIAFVLTIVRTTFYNMMGGMTATDSSDGYYPSWSSTPEGGVFPSPQASMYSTKSREMVPADSDSTYPFSNQGGGIGTYNEAEYDAIAYHATIKKGNIVPVCDTIESWKMQRDVVFESMARNEDACSYSFKVPHALHQNTLANITQFDPEDVSADIETTKKQAVQYSGELAILLQKQEILETTLHEATVTFEELMATARSIGDVDALSKTIDKKLTYLKQLSDERITLASQIQYKERQMSELRDRVDFVHFTVYVQRYEIVDGGAIKDYWVYAMQNFIQSLNRSLQDMTLGLVLGLLTIAKIIVYLAILLVLLKYGWRSVRTFWRQ